MQGDAVVVDPHRFRLGQVELLPTADRSDHEHRAFPRGRVVGDDLGRRPGSRPDRDQPVVGPAELTVDAPGDLADRTCRDVDHAEPPESVLVAGEGDPVAVR